MERKQLDSVLLREGEQFITYLITDEKEEKSILKLVNPEFQILTMGRQAAGLKLVKAFNEWRKLRNVNFNLDKSTEAANGKEALHNFATRLVSVLNPLFHNEGKFNYKYKFK